MLWVDLQDISAYPPAPQTFWCGAVVPISRDRKWIAPTVKSPNMLTKKSKWPVETNFAGDYLCKGDTLLKNNPLMRHLKIRNAPDEPRLKNYLRLFYVQFLRSFCEQSGATEVQCLQWLQQHKFHWLYSSSKQVWCEWRSRVYAIL